MRLRRNIITVLVIGFIVSLAASSAVIARELTPEQESQIQTNCQSIKSIMNQLHVSDALLRVNRGQLYESVATKLMDRFNSRVESSDFEEDNFSVITTNYRQTLSKFRSDYVNYERQLTRAIDIDCQQDPAGFDSALQTARTLRFKVRDDIQLLNEYIKEYQSAVNDFHASYKELTAGGND